jgi:hypothetical protein
MSRLHVTNHDAAAEGIAAVMAPEPVLPWRDELYQGPVRDGLALEALSEERAEYFAARFRPDPERLRARFQDRDQRLREALQQGSELTIWFARGLDDQLLLIQLLDLVGREMMPAARVRLAQADTYLAELVPAALCALAVNAAPARPAQLELARAAWAAFRAPTLEALACLREADTSALPWLGLALERLLEELPTDYPGLSATERYILEELGPGPLPAGELHARCRARERIWFMSARAFFAVLDELAAEPMPLVAGPPADGYSFTGDHATHAAYLEAEVRITHEGRLTREGRLDRAVAKPLDRWLGGTHLTNDDVWWWEPATATLRRSRGIRCVEQGAVSG